MWQYQEDGWIAEVEILENLSDKRREAYTLKVIKTIQENAFRRPPNNETTFTCWKIRRANPGFAAALWHMKKVEHRKK